MHIDKDADTVYLFLCLSIPGRGFVKFSYSLLVYLQVEKGGFRTSPLDLVVWDRTDI